jgi:hypothetical protein
MEISVENVLENCIIAKIINQDDSDRRTHAEALFLMINTSEEKFSITVTRLADLKSIFAFEFTQSKEVVEEAEPTSPDHKKRLCPLKKNKPFPEYRR